MKQLGNPAELVHGDRYAAVALVTAPRVFATDSAIASKVAGYGFEDVVAQKDTPPPGWPAGAATLPAPSSGFHAYVLATWAGATGKTPMPGPIKAAWDMGPAKAGATPSTTTPPARQGATFGELIRVVTLGTAAGEVLEEMWTDLGL